MIDDRAPLPVSRGGFGGPRKPAQLVLLIGGITLPQLCFDDLAAFSGGRWEVLGIGFRRIELAAADLSSA